VAGGCGTASIVTVCGPSPLDVQTCEPEDAEWHHGMGEEEAEIAADEPWPEARHLHLVLIGANFLWLRSPTEFPEGADVTASGRSVSQAGSSLPLASDTEICRKREPE